MSTGHELIGSLQPASDVAEAKWIQGWFDWRGGVRNLVGPDYASYTRIFHPWNVGYDDLPTDDRGEAWANIAKKYGSVLRADTVSADLDNLQGENGTDDPPLVGELALPVLAHVYDLLAAYTETSEKCFFALWEGWGWVQEARISPDRHIGRIVLKSPTFEVPHRRYLLFEGAIKGAADALRQTASTGRHMQSPSFVWPADHAWNFATEVDADWSIVGGSSSLGTRLVSDKIIEAMTIGGDVLI